MEDKTLSKYSFMLIKIIGTSPLISNRYVDSGAICVIPKPRKGVLKKRKEVVASLA